MQTLYQAANAVEAHMLQDLLRQEGVATEIEGAYLQGAIGELPASGLVRLVVDDAQYARGREIIERWEAQAVVEPVPPRPRSTASRSLLAGCVGLAIGVAGSAWFFRSPMSVDGIDHNRDGVLDERWTYSPSGAPLGVQIDRNLDGKVDYIARYDVRGQIESAEADDDFDGRFETRIRYRAGNVETQDVDTDGDSYADLRSTFVNGVLSFSEFVDARTGLPVLVEHYRLGRMQYADADTDGDGRLDTRTHYGPFHRRLRDEPLPAPAR